MYCGLITFFLIALCSLTLGSIDSKLQDLDLSKLPNNLGNITNQIDVEKAEELLQEKCLKNSGREDTYENAKEEVVKAQECLKSILDFEKMQKQIADAQPTGDLDLVFKDYCEKAPKVKSCIMDVVTAYEPCLDKDELETKKTFVNVTDSLLDFVCFKDGDRIALFIAEGGVKCINDSSALIKSCVETTFNRTLDENHTSLDSLPFLLIRDEECDKFTKLQTCVVAAMEKCHESTPSNVVESLFNFIRKRTPCANIKTNTLKSTSSASTLALGSSIAMATISSYLLLH